MSRFLHPGCDGLRLDRTGGGPTYRTSSKERGDLSKRCKYFTRATLYVEEKDTDGDGDSHWGRRRNCRVPESEIVLCVDPGRRTTGPATLDHDWTRRSE